MKKPPETLTINGLASATAVDRRTIRKRLAEAGMLAGRSSWSLAETLPLILGGRPSSRLESARLQLLLEQKKKTAAEAELAQFKVDEACRKLLPADAVARVWDGTILQMRNIITGWDISEDKKRELLKELQNVSIDEYLDTTAPIQEEGPLGPSTEP